jgi:hypothetical protein
MTCGTWSARAALQPRLETRVRDDKIEVGFPAATAGELPELANLQIPPKPS